MALFFLSENLSAMTPNGWLAVRNLREAGRTDGLDFLRTLRASELMAERFAGRKMGRPGRLRTNWRLLLQAGDPRLRVLKEALK
jgi:hypothetical protein